MTTCDNCGAVTSALYAQYGKQVCLPCSILKPKKDEE